MKNAELKKKISDVVRKESPSEKIIYVDITDVWYTTERLVRVITAWKGDATQLTRYDIWVNRQGEITSHESYELFDATEKQFI